LKESNAISIGIKFELHAKRRPLNLQKPGMGVRFDEAVETTACCSQVGPAWEVIEVVEVVRNFFVDIGWKTEQYQRMHSCGGWRQVLSVAWRVPLGNERGCIGQRVLMLAGVAGGNMAVPEARLPTMMIGSFFVCAGLFMFGWTSSTSIHWIVPCVSLVLLGFGFLAIFQGCVNYLIDTLQQYAASAIAAFLRSIFAAAFALFGNPMCDSLGLAWSLSIFGFIAVAMIPVPFLFYIYGPKLRGKGVNLK
jgi:hypothetical protein